MTEGVDADHCREIRILSWARALRLIIVIFFAARHARFSAQNG